MDYECGIQREDRIYVLADPLAHMYGEDGVAGTHLVCHLFDVVHRHVGYARYANPVGHIQYGTDLLRIELRRHGTPQYQCIRGCLPEHPASFDPSLTEIHEELRAEGPRILGERAHVGDQLSLSGLPQVSVLQTIGRGHQLFQGQSPWDL